MIVKKNTTVALGCIVLEGVGIIVFVALMAILTGVKTCMEILSDVWMLYCLIGAIALFMFKELLDVAVNSRGEKWFKFWEEFMSGSKIELDSCGISERLIGQQGETVNCFFKSWKELTLSTGKWYDWGGFVFRCPKDPPNDDSYWTFFSVNFFLANRKQLMEFAVKHIPKENIPERTLLRLRKMGIYT
jgi:hypothetical protein